MNYNRILIHPLGKEDEVAPIIREVVENCEGYLATKRLLGMLHFEAQFENDTKAQACMDALQEIDEVSHVEWVENQ